MGIKFGLSPLGQIIWEDRYALKDENGNLIEKDIFETFQRVAKAIASKEENPKLWEKKFYDIMASRCFLPAGRILAHSGTHYSQLLNCFVLPFEKDSLEAIMNTAKNMAVVQKFGGGCGFNYSTLRPAGSYIKGVNGHSCGVIGFINMMSTISGVIEQGGSRRGANLGLLEVWHPDVWELVSYKNEHNWEHLRNFIEVKDEEQWAYFKYENFYKLQMYNLSVGLTNEFFEAIEKDEIWPLMWQDKEWELYTVVFKKAQKGGKYKEKKFDVTANCDTTALWKVKRHVPYPTGEDRFDVISKRKIKASEIWNRICYNAWADGCPGIMNISELRRMHNLEYVNPITAPNPCLHGDSLMLTGSGLQRIKNLVGKEEYLWDGEEWVKGEIICTGIRPVYEMRLSNGMALKGTLDHKIFDMDDNEIELGNSLGYNIQRMKGFPVLRSVRTKGDVSFPTEPDNFREYWGPSEKYSGVHIDDFDLISLGFIFGDGNFHKASNRYKYVYIGEKDGDIFSLFESNNVFLEESDRYDRYILPAKFATKCEELKFPPVSLPERNLSDKILKLPPNQMCCFLRGLFSANGSVLEKAKRITYKSSCRELIDQLQIILMALGIQSYVTTNKSHDVEFKNGIYTCKENYDLNITSEDLIRFSETIGFVQAYKDVLLKKILPEKIGNRIQPKAVSLEYIGDEYVYDFKMPERHYAFVNGLKAHNCGEQPLPPNGSCNLSSLPLPSFVNKELKCINYDLLRETIRVAVRFADDVIDNCDFPLTKIKEKAYSERRIGLGTFGVHDMLIELELGYDTDEGRRVVEEVLKFIRDEAYITSIKLAKEKGSFPAFDKEKFLKSGFVKTLPSEIVEQIDKIGIRNGALLSQAPTGTTGTMYNFSTGCEPWFSLAFQRNTRLGSYEDGIPAYMVWKEKNPDKSKPFYFRTAQEISSEDHVKMMILFSKYSDSAVSKTINLPSTATVEDVQEAFLFAIKNGVKGLTVFRDKSKEGVLVNKEGDKKGLLKEAQKVVHEMQDIEEKETFKDTPIYPKKRGSKTTGSTYRIHMQGHNLYITANKNKNNELVEVFTTVGESKINTHRTSGVEDSWAEGLGKMISLALRAGVDPFSIIRNLKNIPSDKPVFSTIGDLESSELISSPPHAIARVIEEEIKKSCENDNTFYLKDKQCEECGSINIKPKSPTCYECLDCSYVSCG